MKFCNLCNSIILSILGVQKFNICERNDLCVPRPYCDDAKRILRFTACTCESVKSKLHAMPSQSFRIIKLHFTLCTRVQLLSMVSWKMFVDMSSLLEWLVALPTKALKTLSRENFFLSVRIWFRQLLTFALVQRPSFLFVIGSWSLSESWFYGFQLLHNRSEAPL